MLEGEPKPYKVLCAKWSRALSAPREYEVRPLPEFTWYSLSGGEAGPGIRGHGLGSRRVPTPSA
jgi:hypothetical protein